jgi:AraC family transcriptional regulator of adaptative response/methylated-DNA-[protein]-cysteine methyltransferase
MIAAPALFSPATPPSLPTADEMYRALVERDDSLDGVFVAGVKTTGIFCRPGCGAKKPLRENVEFFPDHGAALRAGYRPCLRCRPLDRGRTPPDFVRLALELIEDHPDERITAADLRARGLDPHRVTRYFKAHYGLTFQAFHRARRVGRALAPLRTGAPVARAAAATGFDSESGFREAFTRLFGAVASASSRSSAAAAEAKSSHAPAVVLIRWLGTPLGPMLAGASDEGVCLLEFIDRRAIETQITVLRRRLAAASDRPIAMIPDLSASASSPAASHLTALATQLAAYFAGTRTTFTVPLHTPGTDFQRDVWRMLQEIPCGQVRSYAQQAAAIGRPTATRAVARANGDNRIAIVIPCHRVIGADGSLTGYGGQLWRKQWLLDHERSMAARATRP